MRWFSMRLNPESKWDRQIADFLEGIPKYYRSKVVKGILIQHLSGKAPEEIASSNEALAEECSEENPELDRKLDSMF